MSTLLEGVRVLDLSRVFAGPFATQMLADLGADVIKIERPGQGDEARHQGRHLRDASGAEIPFTPAFVSMNRGKRSVSVNIATAQGQDIVRSLAAHCDVLVENYKVGDLKRYGLDYETLHGCLPDLIYCSISGFGQDGPRSGQPGYDLVFQAMSGVMSITGNPDGEPGGGPQRVGYSVADITASYHAAIAILGALYARKAGTAAGQHIDIALLDCQMAAASHVAMQYLLTGVQPARVGAASHFMAPYQPFQCQDGPLVVLCGNDDQFRKLAAELGMPDLAQDARYATNGARLEHREELAALLAPVFLRDPRDTWTRRLGAAGVPCAPIHDLAQAYADPQVRHRGTLMQMPFAPTGTLPQVANPLRFSETPVRYDRLPPALGEHTEEVCAQLLGIPVERLRALRESGVL
jgi:crotonobetainyl-CoA:carnitine CoA-transferase CaiB-like acyl-CoA transferase